MEEQKVGYYPLGDGIGTIDLLDTMGSDLGIVNAARVSHLGESKGEKADRKLLHYLYQHQHWTPFRQQVMKFRVKCPLFTARQWRTHQWADYEDVQ
jgi:thymidylate synthase (FAD)